MNEESMFQKMKVLEQKSSENELGMDKLFLGLSLEELEKNIRKERKFKHGEESYLGKIEREAFEKELSETIESAQTTRQKYEEAVKNKKAEKEKIQKEEKATNFFKDLIKSGNVLKNITSDNTVVLFCKEKKGDELIVKKIMFDRKYIGKEESDWEELVGYRGIVSMNKNRPIAWQDVYAVDIFSDVKENELTPEEVVFQLDKNSVEKLLQS